MKFRALVLRADLDREAVLLDLFFQYRRQQVLFFDDTQQGRQLRVVVKIWKIDDVLFALEIELRFGIAQVEGLARELASERERFFLVLLRRLDMVQDRGPDFRQREPLQPVV